MILDNENVFIIGGGAIGWALSVLLCREKRIVIRVRARAVDSKDERKFISMSMGYEFNGAEIKSRIWKARVWQMGLGSRKASLKQNCWESWYCKSATLDGSKI